MKKCLQHYKACLQQCFSRAVILVILKSHLLMIFICFFSDILWYSHWWISKVLDWFVLDWCVHCSGLHAQWCECEFILLCYLDIYWVLYFWGFVITTFVWSVYVQFRNTNECIALRVCIISLPLQRISICTVPFTEIQWKLSKDSTICVSTCVTGWTVLAKQSTAWSKTQGLSSNHWD